MPKKTEIDASRAAILSRVWDASGTMAPPVARAILELAFPDADLRRIEALAERNRDGSISAGELQELDNFLEVEQILGALQSKARKSLKARKVALT